MTDLLYSEVEEDLRGTLRSLLSNSGPAQILKRIETPETYDTALWRAMAVDLGLAGLLVPEALGGAGASAREAAVVCEELGRAIAPVPFLGSAVVATTALLALGAADLLGALARGERTAALAVPLSAAALAVPLSAAAPVVPLGAAAVEGTLGAAAPVVPLGGAAVEALLDAAAVAAPTVSVVGGRLTGSVTSVGDALPADLFLVPADGGLYAVDAAEVTVTPVVSLDMTRQLADLTFDGATGTRLGDAPAAVGAAIRAGAALLASEQYGLASWCLDTTVDYMKTRYQFGRAIGSFQALKHRIADVWVEVTQARAVARYAADCLATGDPDLPAAVSIAQAFNGPAAVRAAEECLQLHGGIGFTWEYPIHLYLKRAKSDSIAFGTAATHRATLAGLVDVPAQ